jgi:hypothetical protein
MSKKTFMAAIIILAFLISLVTVMQAVKVAQANPIPWAFDPQMTVTIQSPASGANCALPLLVSFTAQGDFQFSVSDNLTQNYLRSFFYVLDGKDLRTSGLRFAGTKTTEIYGDPVYHYNFSGQANLTDLTGGLHSITVYYGAVNSIGLIGSPDEMIVYNPDWSATTQFYVDSTPSPSPTPTPSVPEFTVTLVSPPPDSHFVNKTIELSIKNHPSFSNYGFFYNVRIRINDGNWSLLYTIDDVPSQSTGEYTNLSYPSDQPVVEYQYNLGDRIQDLFAGDKVDFQVQAMIGSIHRTFNPNATNQLEMYPYVFTGEMSDWSRIQTITIPEGNASPIQEPTLNPSPTSRVLKNFTDTIDSYFFYGGIYAYTYNVSMSVETELNGEWVVGNSYQIAWQISIVNFSPEAIQEPSNLSLTFHDPFVGSISGTQRTIVRQTPVTIGQDGFLKVEFTPDKPVNQADVQTTLLQDQNYSSRDQFKNAHWDQNFDIWINVVDSLATLPSVTASPTIPELSYCTAVILAILATTIILASLKSRKD